MGDSGWERRQGTGRPASGDSSSRREERTERQTETERKRVRWEVGRALFKEMPIVAAAEDVYLKVRP